MFFIIFFDTYSGGIIQQKEFVMKKIASSKNYSNMKKRASADLQRLYREYPSLKSVVENLDKGVSNLEVQLGSKTQNDMDALSTSVVTKVNDNLLGRIQRIEKYIKDEVDDFIYPVLRHLVNSHNKNVSVPARLSSNYREEEAIEWSDNSAPVPGGE